MASLKIKLVSKKEIATGTTAFHFAKPKGYNYLAGQYCDWFLPQVLKSRKETGIRSFSLSSAPFEKELMITIRNRNTAFKNALNSFSKGLQIIMNGPQGDLILENSKKSLVLIAGGIGVTPFRSIILQARNDKNPGKIFLFHFNRHVKDAPFLEEFNKLKNKNFKYIPVITQDKSWTGEKGHLTKNLLLKYIRSLPMATYYLAGSPDMVRNVKKELIRIKIPEEVIRQEEFDGY